MDTEIIGQYICQSEQKLQVNTRQRNMSIRSQISFEIKIYFFNTM